MNTHRPLFLALAAPLCAALTALVVVGCAASPAMPASSTGGAPGTGGAVGTGGSAPGTGGTAVATGGASGLMLGTGGPFPFPQNKKPGMCLLTSVADPATAVNSAYSYWKTTFVTSSGAGSGLRVRRPGNQDDTVSEGIGYGMIAAAYMADRPTFDGLWTYAKAHLDTHGLMTWHLNAGGSVVDAGSATDGDVDIAWALVMGSNQWSSPTYLTEAKTMINAISNNCIGPDGTLKPGDGWGGTALTNPSYFSPAYFRVFAAVTGDNNWKTVILDKNYAILNSVSGTSGLVPDWSNNSGAVNQGSLMGGMYDSSHYGYDACRTPWRIALDYCFNGEPRAQAYLSKIGGFFNALGAANIGDQYAVTGAQTMGNKNMAFIGTAGVAGMAGYQSLVDGAFMYGATNNGGNTAYFPQSLRVLTMLMMSGNFVDFTKPKP